MRASEVEFHRGIAKENPGAPHIVVGGAVFGAQDQCAQWIVGRGRKLMQQRQIHGHLRRLLVNPDDAQTATAPPLGARIRGLRQAFGIDVLEQAIQAIDDHVDGEAAAIRQRGCVVGVEQFSEGPLLLGTVSVVVCVSSAPLLRAARILRASGRGVDAIGKNL